jgi:hypothetical protein
LTWRALVGKVTLVTGDTNVRVTREDGVTDRLRGYELFIDGQRAGELLPGRSVTVPCMPGTHTIKLRLDWSGSGEVTCTAAEGQTAEFTCRPRRRGLASFVSFVETIARRDRWIVLERTTAG